MVVLSKLTLMITLHALAWDEIKGNFYRKKGSSSVSMEITQHNKEGSSSSSSSSKKKK